MSGGVLNLYNNGESCSGIAAEASLKRHSLGLGHALMSNIHMYVTYFNKTMKDIKGKRRVLMLHLGFHSLKDKLWDFQYKQNISLSFRCVD